ncbi:MAG: hypothetical protein ACLP1Q_00895 [Solirubrobacteraceae bacterium]|jgi:hypothetical protein
MPLPSGYETQFRDSLVRLAGFSVTDTPDGSVEVEPGEGSGVITRYFNPFRLGDVATDFSQQSVWQPVFDHPPWGQKPNIPLAPSAQKRLAELRTRDDILAVSQRLGFDAAQANAAGIPGIFQRELQRLFELYPDGSLWYVAVDHRLVSRLSVLRIRLQLTLTPDVSYDAAAERVAYFGIHTTTNGSNFQHAFDNVLLVIPPTAMGFGIGVLPHVFVFQFGKVEDLRLHGPVGLGARFFPYISAARGIPGVKFPRENLAIAHLESLLSWWTTRLSVIYSYAADPTNFADDAGVHDGPAQAAWLFTLERMMADAAVLLADVDAPALLRMQAAFDLLDKADSLLTRRGKSADGTNFRRLLKRDEALVRLERAFDLLPVQLRPRFKEWAQVSYDRLYEDIKQSTMPSRRRDNGVLVALNDPAKPVLRSWDEYVSKLMRAARNSSHGLQDMMRPPAPSSTKPDSRLLLATNSGEVPYSFYEVVAVVFIGLMADAERLCDRSWWSVS